MSIKQNQYNANPLTPFQAHTKPRDSGDRRLGATSAQLLAKSKGNKKGGKKQRGRPDRSGQTRLLLKKSCSVTFGTLSTLLACTERPLALSHWRKQLLEAEWAGIDASVTVCASRTLVRLRPDLETRERELSTGSRSGGSCLVIRTFICWADCKLKSAPNIPS